MLPRSHHPGKLQNGMPCRVPPAMVVEVTYLTWMTASSFVLRDRLAERAMPASP
jgi:hypothetical protein